MVKSASGKVDMRSFTIVDVRKANGAPTKFPKDTRFVNKTPAQAAQKMGNKLCNMKRVSGRCVFLIRVQETTQGSNNKTFDYTFKRVKLDEPVEIGDRKYFYTSKVYSEKDTNKFSKTNMGFSTSGRMVSKSRRVNTVNNEQPKYKKEKTSKSSKSKSTKAKQSKSKTKKSKSFLQSIFN